MSIIFMGTPEFAVFCLKKLLEEGYPVVGVVTQPDKPQGRKKQFCAPPVKAVAEQYHIPVIQPRRVGDADAIAWLSERKPTLIITAAFGQILPKSVLNLPEQGCVNVHASLLPKYRGGAPIQRCLMNGETMTGVTLMYMATGLDTGNIITAAKVPISREDTAGTMFHKLGHAGAHLLIQQMPQLLSGVAAHTAQDDKEATYAPNLSREDEKINWHHGSEQIYNQIRALVPSSGVFTHWNDTVLKVWMAEDPLFHESNVQNNDTSCMRPGTVLCIDHHGIEVATGDGCLRLIEVQPAGKKRMKACHFVHGTSLSVGTVLV